MVQNEQVTELARVKVRVRADYAAIVPLFICHVHADVEASGAALQAGDFDSIRVRGHNMAGTGGALGFPLISEIGKALELAARSLDAAGVETCLGQLAEYLDRVEVVYG